LRNDGRAYIANYYTWCIRWETTGTIGLLRALLKREIEPAPLRCPTPCPAPSPTARRKPRTKSYPVFRLYPAREPEPQRQAEMLLREIATYCEDAIGQYIPTGDLQRLYLEFCGRQRWEPRHWSVIGYELGRLTHRVIKKVRSKRFKAYKIPAPDWRL